MGDWSLEKWLDVCRSVVMQAREDQEYRHLAVVNPAEAVRRVSDIDLPDGLVLQIVDPAIANLTLALPPLEANEGAGAGAEGIMMASPPEWQTVTRVLGLMAQGRLSVPFGGTVMAGSRVVRV